ncbi:MAG: CaiB/BaiF CoA-transferase family protein [Pseudomonadales bacterium]|jgi:crotonobetainyl-CoA:carnitine CoA-transferase CaiB-like acyl-CoA transferase|nr:CaiB/BaiF CoA-transferase family protein [Pseudomonadales bacterium]
MTHPLDGLRVLDFSRVLAGPFAGRMLADLGADVVKIEPPEGDVTRLWGRRVGGIAGYFHQQNAGKRDLCMDLSRPGAAELVHALAERADVILENFRPGVMDRLGIGYAALARVNPRLVMLSISGFGQGGPESGRAAYAPIIHAESGVVAREAALSQRPPRELPVSIADTNASLHGLVALLAALLARERTGRGDHIDIAMLDAMLATDDHLHYALEDAEHTRPMQSEVWDTVIGPVMLSGDFRHLWKQLTAVCGVADPTPPGAALEEKIALRRRAAADFLAQLPDREALVKALDRMNLAWGPVRASRDLATESPTVQARGTLVEIDDRAGGSRPIVQSPYRFAALDSGVRGPAPHRGEHNEAVLAEWLGLAPERIAALRDAGILLADDRTGAEGDGAS